MRLAVWVTEGTWPATIDAARDLIGDDQAEVMLIHVLEAGRPPREGFGSLMGRGRVRRSEEQLHQWSEEAAQQMLDQAAERLGRPATVRLETGFPERIVTAVADEVDYLVIGRDGDRSRLGPHSLGKHTRFVVDHAPCRVLLIWPGDVPSSGSLPPPPPDR
ncbi:universal stress protein [Micropruina glycogenica]|uniref:Nucleotide-binding universal stress protein, UspA family n=1 Tax=Micropruina glycogenica TaxID=75385 RepID=A0A2N9JDW2_9ACTN|nr:universal stress protein [Micropruina glycogenica]SPD85698.1 Nucleotide-binding universal stress protein, UspA family [Micropruina glycogenica]